MDSQDLIESLECALLLVDTGGKIVRVNIAAETLFCQSRRYLVGLSIPELIPDELVQSCVHKCMTQNAKFTLREIELEISGYQALVDMTLSAVGGTAKSGSATLIEINSINRISRFMKEKNQLERQQSFRLMMRGLAHEIKNPLGGIRGAAQLLDREIKDPSRKELTDILIKEADRLTRLVDRVMGSREQLKPVRLNIHEVLEHVVHLVSVKNSKRLVVNRIYDPALPEVSVDREQMIQAVLNIVGNAIEAQDGKRFITLGLITKFERFVTINQAMHRQALKIKIWDEGPGVPEEMKEILFDPLITGRPEGSGLGLSITQEIVQRHNGVVLLEDYHGKTCFSIYLPYTSEEESDA
ncbi:nitrogen regulation protein NR(II) [Arenicella xantha]|uniref:Sensory histidine kinase/phosphatase NtrB n=1 Tax=Arenicella xantha TaxID=644221 RepID=A0A395JSI5_9GAMM|nr:nitrogen regulation protein NR(II) [Arenicella xantha]RBP53312.1 PAS/PAC sensor signal transduction histidine kinase [Arenicella xantha]